MLDPTSFHPKHTTGGILKSQLIRFKRISSFKEDYDVTCKILFNALKRRNYSYSFMSKQKNQIWFNYSDRLFLPSTPEIRANSNNSFFLSRPQTPSCSSSLLQSDPKTQTELLPIITNFNQIGLRLSKKYRDLISQHELFKKYKILSAFCNHKNLYQTFIRSRLPSPSATVGHISNQHSPSSPHFLQINQTPSSPSPTALTTTHPLRCNGPKCLTCPCITKSTTFVSTNNHRKFIIHEPLNCKSTNIIYLITCLTCTHQYVGETSRTLAERITDHRSNIKLKKPTPISAHFNQINHTSKKFHVTPIQIIKDPFKRRARELYWQNILKTKFPEGINHTNPNFILPTV